MDVKKKHWFNVYYFIIIVICLMVGIFIWFLFSLELSALTPEKAGSAKENASTNK